MLIQREFWIRPGVAVLPEAVPAPFWGIASGPNTEPQLPGPTIEGKVGDTLELTLHNRLNEPMSLIFPGQNTIPDPQLNETGQIVSLTNQAPPGESVTYTINLTRPGTFRYEAGTSPEKQVQMGLYGALVVRPSDFNAADSRLRTAYGSRSGSNFDVEAVIVLSELDMDAHTGISASGAYDPLTFAPQYRLVNGRPFPDCVAPQNESTQPLNARVTALSGQKVLLRVINSGFLSHSLCITGGPVRVVAEDGWPLQNAALDATYEKTVIAVGPGQTCDMVYVPPLGEHIGFGRDLAFLLNDDRGPGGMIFLTDVRTDFPAAPPSDPVGLSASLMTGGRVGLAWTTGGVDTEGIVVERRAGVAGAFLRLATLIGQITGYEDTDTQEDTTYYYRILGFNVAGYSGYSNEVSITTPLLLQAPSALTATAGSAPRVELTWTDNSPDEDGFSIERRHGDTSSFNEIATVPADTTHYADEGIIPATTYVYRVRSYRDQTVSEYSNEATITTPLYLDAPSNLIATALSSSQIEITWQDNSFYENGFGIERTGGDSSAFVEVAVTGPEATTFLDQDLLPDTVYTYRVRAYRGSDASDYSNEATATTQDAIPSPPSNLIIEKVGVTSVRLQWDDNSENENGFFIERSRNESFSIIDRRYFVPADLTVFYTIVGRSRAYYFRVKAYNNLGISAPSNVVSVSL